MVVGPPDGLNPEVPFLPIGIQYPSGIPSANVQGKLSPVIRAHERVPRPPLGNLPETVFKSGREIITAIVGHGRSTEFDEVETGEEQPPLQVVLHAHKGARGVQQFTCCIEFPRHAVEADAHHLKGPWNAVFDAPIVHRCIWGRQESDGVGVVFRCFGVMPRGPLQPSFDAADFQAPSMSFSLSAVEVGAAVDTSLAGKRPALK